MSSSVKWRVYVTEDFYGISRYGPDVLDRLEEVINIPLGKNVLRALRSSWKGTRVIDNDCVLYTPIWYHPEFQLLINPEWNRKIIRKICDVIGYTRCDM